MRNNYIIDNHLDNELNDLSQYADEYNMEIRYKPQPKITPKEQNPKLVSAYRTATNTVISNHAFNPQNIKKIKNQVLKREIHLNPKMKKVKKKKQKIKILKIQKAEKKLYLLRKL